MALIQCVDCEKHVSEHAEQCPHCGSPIAALRRREQSEAADINTAVSALKPVVATVFSEDRVVNNKRITALGLDVPLVAVVYLFIGVLLDEFSVLALCVATVLWFIPDLVSGMSLGKRFMGLKVVDEVGNGNFAIRWRRYAVAFLPMVIFIAIGIPHKHFVSVVAAEAAEHRIQVKETHLIGSDTLEWHPGDREAQLHWPYVKVLEPAINLLFMASAMYYLFSIFYFRRQLKAGDRIALHDRLSKTRLVLARPINGPKDGAETAGKEAT